MVPAQLARLYTAWPQRRAPFSALTVNIAESTQRRVYRDDPHSLVGCSAHCHRISSVQLGVALGERNADGHELRADRPLPVCSAFTCRVCDDELDCVHVRVVPRHAWSWPDGDNGSECGGCGRHVQRGVQLRRCSVPSEEGLAMPRVLRTRAVRYCGVQRSSCGDLSSPVSTILNTDRLGTVYLVRSFREKREVSPPGKNSYGISQTYRTLMNVP